MSRPDPPTFSPAHNTWLERRGGLRHGAVLAIYASNESLMRAVKRRILDETVLLGPRTSRDTGLEEALLIHFIYITELALNNGSEAIAESRIAYRKKVFKERYDWKAAKIEVSQFMRRNPQPGINSILDGAYSVAWFTEDHFDWLALMTGMTAPHIYGMLRESETIVARAVRAVKFPPWQALDMQSSPMKNILRKRGVGARSEPRRVSPTVREKHEARIPNDHSPRAKRGRKKIAPSRRCIEQGHTHGPP